MREINLLEIDTRLFGFKVGEYSGRRLSPSIAKDLTAHCQRYNIECLYAECNLSDFHSLETAVEYGFLISDVRVEFEKSLVKVNCDSNQIGGYRICEDVRRYDIPHLEKISDQISIVSRFNFDKNFPIGSAEKMYRYWLRNSVRGNAADKVFIAREARTGRPIGFVTCKKLEDSIGKIDLIGVAEKHRGKGLASSLIDYACGYFKRSGLKKIRLRTPGSNTHALLLYQKNGFYIQRITVFFHLWPLSTELNDKVSEKAT